MSLSLIFAVYICWMEGYNKKSAESESFISNLYWIDTVYTEVIFTLDWCSYLPCQQFLIMFYGHRSGQWLDRDQTNLAKKL